jgi:hypothetical protein
VLLRAARLRADNTNLLLRAARLRADNTTVLLRAALLRADNVHTAARAARLRADNTTVLLRAARLRADNTTTHRAAARRSAARRQHHLLLRAARLRADNTTVLLRAALLRADNVHTADNTTVLLRAARLRADNTTVLLRAARLRADNTTTTVLLRAARLRADNTTVLLRAALLRADNTTVLLRAARLRADNVHAALLRAGNANVLLRADNVHADLLRAAQHSALSATRRARRALLLALGGFRVVDLARRQPLAARAFHLRVYRHPLRLLLGVALDGERLRLLLALLFAQRSIFAILLIALDTRLTLLLVGVRLALALGARLPLRLLRVLDRSSRLRGGGGGGPVLLLGRRLLRRRLRRLLLLLLGLLAQFLCTHHVVRCHAVIVAVQQSARVNSPGHRAARCSDAVERRRRRRRSQLALVTVADPRQQLVDHRLAIGDLALELVDVAVVVGVALQQALDNGRARLLRLGDAGETLVQRRPVLLADFDVHGLQHRFDRAKIVCLGTGELRDVTQALAVADAGLCLLRRVRAGDQLRDEKVERMADAVRLACVVVQRLGRRAAAVGTYEVETLGEGQKLVHLAVGHAPHQAQAVHNGVSVTRVHKRDRAVAAQQPLQRRHDGANLALAARPMHCDRLERRPPIDRRGGAAVDADGVADDGADGVADDGADATAADAVAERRRRLVRTRLGLDRVVLAHSIAVVVVKVAQERHEAGSIECRRRAAGGRARAGGGGGRHIGGSIECRLVACVVLFHRRRAAGGGGGGGAGGRGGGRGGVDRHIALRAGGGDGGGGGGGGGGGRQHRLVARLRRRIEHAHSATLRLRQRRRE